MKYYIIGDIHGQAEKLKKLLKILGYRTRSGAYRHPEGRMVLFLGDLIDRGPGQVEVINIVRNMIEAGSGRTIMGNHEFNAIGYATRCADGIGYLRRRNEKNNAQHSEFLRQVKQDSALHKEMVQWFKTLPVFLDLGGVRLCHAWWNQKFINLLSEQSGADGALNESLLISSFDVTTDAYEAMEGVTKGMEVALPSGYSFVDHSGFERKNIRVRSWDRQATTYREAALVPEKCRTGIPDLELPAYIKLGTADDIPTFLGHYWLTGAPSIQNASTAVLDYGAGIGGPLVAYRWNGETELLNSSFVST